MAQQYFDITPAEVQFLKDIASAGVVTGESLAQKLSTSIGGRGYSLPIYEATISAGQLTLPRVAQKFIVKVDTEGMTSTDTLDELLIETGSEWKTGDEIYIVLTSSARIVTIENGNNIVLSGGTGSTCVLGTDSSIVSLVYNSDAGASGEWIEKYRTPNTNAELTVSTLGFQIESLIVDTGVITLSKTFADVISERSAETLATIAFQITAVGTDATHQVYIDEGNGQFAIADVSWVGVPLITTQLTDIVNAINASGTGYTATDDGVDTYTISAPSGTGATPNASWEGTVNSTGGMTTATTVETFAGGVDGADQNDDIDTINTSQSNQFIWIRNTMSANNLTLKNGVDNISIGADFVILPGEIVGLVVISDVVKKVVCCKKKYQRTIWVDPNGSDATGMRGVFNYPFATIAGAVDASSSDDIIIVHPSGGYNDYNIGNTHNASFRIIEMKPGATIEYDGNIAGYIFGGSNPITRIYNSGKPLVYDVYNYGMGATQSSANLITNIDGANSTSNQIIKQTAGFSQFENLSFGCNTLNANQYSIEISGGGIKLSDCYISTDASSDTSARNVYVSGGVAVFERCVFCHFATDANRPILEATGGKIIFKDCLFINLKNSGSSDAIKASGGEFTFIGINRFKIANAGAYCLNASVAISCKNMGTIYSTNALNGTWNDLITGAGLAITTDADVE